MKTKTFFGLILVLILIGSVPQFAKADPIEDAKLATVTIVFRFNDKVKIGSGIVISPSEILTAAHVVAVPKGESHSNVSIEAKRCFDDSFGVLPSVPLAHSGWVNLKRDLVILHPKSGALFSNFISIGKHQPRMHDPVYLVIGPTDGSPHTECSSEAGRVVPPYKRAAFKGTFAVDPPIFQGESGTAVVNPSGELVGIAVAAGFGRTSDKGAKSYWRSKGMYSCTVVSLSHIQNTVDKKSGIVMPLPLDNEDLPQWKIKH